MMKKFVIISSALLLLFLNACRQNDDFPAIPTAISGPIVVPTAVVDQPTVQATATMSNTVHREDHETAAPPVTATSAPITSSNSSPPTAAPCTVPDDWPIYTVVAGDTLFEIAQATNTTVNQLVDANCLADRNTLEIGQKLAVPQLPTADEPFSTQLSVNPSLSYAQSIDGYLLQEGSVVQLTWSPKGRFPAAAGNQLEFVYMPINGENHSLGIFENVSGPVTLEWVVPENVMGAVNTTFRWTGEENWAVQYLTFAAVEPNQCHFSAYGIGGGTGILSEPNVNSAVLSHANAGEMYLVEGIVGERDDLYYQVYFSNGSGWVDAARGALFGTGCDHLQALNQQPHLTSFITEPEAVHQGEIITLKWSGVGDKATLCPTARYSYFTAADCQQVGASGSLTVDLPDDLPPAYALGYILTLERGGQTAAYNLAIRLYCERNWFYSSEKPLGPTCPQAAQPTAAAAQHFERGTMLWLETPGVYYILTGAPLGSADTYHNYPLLRAADPLNITQDTSGSVTAPAGLFAPESGFGLLWRGDTTPAFNDLNDKLGWATAPEFAYQATLQCDDAPPSGGRSWQSCYLQGPEGDMIHILPANYGQWQLIKTAP